MDNNRRYFVLTSGRTGSSLLCAILADAGADFGMPAPDEWDRTGGAMEHPLIVKAARHQGIALAAAPTVPLFGLAKFDWKLRRAYVKWLVRRALRSGTYFKAGGLDRLAGPAIRMGFDVRPIISIRHFDGVAASMLNWPGGFRSFRGIERTYIDTYENALSLLFSFGGCCVDYDDLADPDATEWALQIAEATGLDPAALLDARARRLNGVSHRPAFPLSSAPAQAIYRACMGFAERTLTTGGRTRSAAGGIANNYPS